MVESAEAEMLYNTSLMENLNRNVTEDQGATAGEFYHITQLTERYCLPFICVFGIVGNCLATVTFLQKSLRQTSCCLYLAARSVSDNGFLFNLLIMWIGGTLDYSLGETQGICKIIMFLTYICGCFSVWLVVFVTLENYIRICHPFVVKTWCTTRKAKLTMTIMFISVLSVNHFPLWISDKKCSPLPQYTVIMQAFVYIDTTLTLALPTILMAFLIVAILIRLFQHHKRSQNKRQSKSHAAQVTKMLLAASVTFFTLNFPSHVIRLRLLIGTFMNGSLRPPDIEAAIQILSQLVFYVSFSINLIIYLTFGSNFRKIFKETYKLNSCTCIISDGKNNNVEIRHLVPTKTDSCINGHLYLKIDTDTSEQSYV